MPRTGRSSLRGVLATLLAIATLWFAVWIVLPGPTYFLLTFSVGAPEISAWLIVAACVALLLTVRATSGPHTGRVARVSATIALALACIPFAQFRGTAARAEAQMAEWRDPRGAAPSRFPLLRTTRLSVRDLLLGVPAGAARISRDVRVATVGGMPLTVDVYQPLVPGPHPTVVQIYGGAWQRGAPSANTKAAEWLAAHGWVVFAVDYRHAPGARWPSQRDDIRVALQWIGAHAAQFDADTTRVALIGRSSGAQLAMMVGYDHPPLPVRGVVSYYGPVDLEDAYLHPPRPNPLHTRAVQDTLIGGTFATMRARHREASPITLVRSGLPPTLLVYGARDHIVERRYGERMRDALRRAGVPVWYVEIPWADHAFDEVFSGPSHQLTLYYLERFLARVLA